MFLVKGGEDLRNDERVQLLYTLMNSLVASGATAGGAAGGTSSVLANAAGLPACSAARVASGLSARTYTVIPMTTKIGLLQWVANTATLKQVVSEEMARDDSFCAANLEAVTGDTQAPARGRASKGSKSQSALESLGSHGIGAGIQGQRRTDGASSRTVSIDALAGSSKIRDWILTFDENSFGTAIHKVYKSASASDCREVFDAGSGLIPDDMVRRRLLRMAGGPEVGVRWCLWASEVVGYNTVL